MYIENVMCNSKFIKDMSKKKENLNPLDSKTDKNKEDNTSGYPLYPDSEDIYEKSKETNFNPEDISKAKSSISTNALRRKKIDDVNISDEKDLDVPGAELDDAQEDIGSEDEENNYYSLGGDDHDDLEEDRGE